MTRTTQPFLAPNALSAPAAALDSNEAWDQDASILLLGIRGSGKTSLAILAASCIDFRVVDADQHFYRETGLPRAVFASQHGFEEYRQRELELMRSLLTDNPVRCIIVCGPGSAEGTGQELLAAFRKHHPVVHIIRDPQEIDQYLRTNDLAKIARLSQLIAPSYRALSNFEFYNLSEPADSTDPTDVDNAAGDAHALSSAPHVSYHPSLVLKHVEYDFLRLIYSVLDQGSCPSVLKARHCLSFLPPESKSFTYVLPIAFDRVLEIAADLRNTDLIVDALELVVSLDRFLGDDGTLDHAAATAVAKTYYTLRRNVRLPIIVHVPAPDAASSAAKPGVWAAYQDVLRYGLRLAPEYLTLDLRCDTQAALALTTQKHSTKIIGHFFDEHPGPDAWDSPARLRLVDCARQYGCNLVRIYQQATSPADNAAVQRFRSRVQELDRRGPDTALPLIAYNTGRMGRASCFVNSVLTPVTHELVAGRQGGAGTADDALLTVQAAQRALYESFTLDPLMFGIFGNAVTAAMSPVMHNAAFRFCGMPHHYRTFQSSSLSDMEHFVREPTFGGASISAPFKKAIIATLDYVSPEARAIGAVNTLIPLRAPMLQSLVDGNRQGPVVALFGDNTDWIGIHSCINRNLSPINAVRRRTTALVLGAGGMAQAAVYALIRLGVKTIFIYNRTLTNAEKLVRQFNGQSFSVHNMDLMADNTEERRPGTDSSSSSNSNSGSGSVTPPIRKTGPVAVHAMPSIDEPWPAGIAPPTIVVACIARVSKDGVPVPDIVLPESWLSSPTGGVVVELAYNPIDTPLIQQVRSLSRQGWIPVHGLQVLPEQGFAQFELFTGRKAPEFTMRAEVRKCAESTT
ncbi:hypothetical protein Sste5346_010255 [Sporothrix stenoceras]|uniref:Quinate repressor protein n=1 Tax=Sporothrix stenoceras TaxID=5173 RepID=A0ABR3YH73_9PEZI